MLVTAGNADLIYIFVLLQAANLCTQACVRIMSDTKCNESFFCFCWFEHVHGLHTALEVTTLLQVTRWQVMVRARVSRLQILLSLKRRDSAAIWKLIFPMQHTAGSKYKTERKERECQINTERVCILQTADQRKQPGHWLDTSGGSITHWEAKSADIQSAKQSERDRERASIDYTQSETQCHTVRPEVVKISQHSCFYSFS